MTEEIKTPKEESENTSADNAAQKTNKVRKITNYLLFTVAALLLFSIVSDRIIPLTDNAREIGRAHV